MTRTGPRAGRSVLFGIALALHVAAPLLFFTDTTQNPYLIQIVWIHAGLWTALCYAAVRAWTRGEIPWFRTPLDPPFWAFGAAALLSWLVALFRGGPLFSGMLSEGTKALIFLLLNAYGVYLLSLRMAEEGAAVPLQRVMLAVGAVAALYGLLQYVGIDPLWARPVSLFQGRPVSTYGNPNFLSTAMVLLLPVAVDRAFRARSSAGAFGAGGLSILFGAALLCTMTRSSYLGAVAALACYAVMERRLLAGKVGRATAFVLLGTAIVWLWPSGQLAAQAPTPLERVGELLHAISSGRVYSSLHQRLLIWSCAWEQWRAFPVTGVGWGLFELFYPFYQGFHLSDPMWSVFRTHSNNAHQLFLDIGAQTGLLGAGAALWAAIVAGRMASSAARGTGRSALWAGLLGAVADNMAGNVSLFFAVPAFLFFWTLGQAAHASGGAMRRINTRRPVVRLGLIGVCAFGLAGLGRELRVWEGARAHLQGVRALQRGDTQSAESALDRSARWYPADVQSAYEAGNLHARRYRWAKERGFDLEAESAARKAESAYTRARDANGGYDEIYFNRAALRQARGDLAGALEDLRWAVLINPLNTDAHRLLTTLWGAARPLDVAGRRRALRNAVTFFPMESAFWRALAETEEMSGQAAEAYDAWIKVVRTDFDDRGAWAVLESKAPGVPPELRAVRDRVAGLRRDAAAGRWSEARSATGQLRALLPDNPLLRLIAADLAAREGAWTAALADYRDFLALRPRHREARMNYAYALSQAGHGAEAFAVMTELRTEFPEDDEVARRWKAMATPP